MTESDRRRLALLEQRVEQLEAQFKQWLPLNRELVEDLLYYELNTRERRFLLQLRQQDFTHAHRVVDSLADLSLDDLAKLVEVLAG